MKSGVYKLEGKSFRYDYDSCVVEHIMKATKEDKAEEAEWLQKNGRPLYGIGDDGYIVLDSVGLRRENWKNKESRDEYLSEWIYEMKEELEAMEEDFVKYELPYLV